MTTLNERYADMDNVQAEALAAVKTTSRINDTYKIGVFLMAMYLIETAYSLLTYMKIIKW